MSNLVNPHGSKDLKPLLLEGDALAAEKARAEFKKARERQETQGLPRSGIKQLRKQREGAEREQRKAEKVPREATDLANMTRETFKAEEVW